MVSLFLPLVFAKRVGGRKVAKSFILFLFINPDIALTTANIAKYIVGLRWLYNPLNFFRYCVELDAQYERFIRAHETKVQVLTLFYGLNEEDCRVAEAWVLLRKQPDRFRRVSLAWVIREMYLKRREQRRWVLKNYKMLKKHRAKIERARNKT